MPPSKSSSMKQRTLNFKSVKRNIPSVKSNIKSVKQGFKSVKQNKKFKLKLKREQIDPTATAVKKPRGRAAQNAKLAKCDMHVKLHIPVSICKNLPSVKTNLSSDMKKSSKQVSSSQEQRGAGVYKRHTASPGIKVEAESDENGHLAKPLLGAKKRRGEVIKYQLHLQKEEKFKGMIFDVALGASGDIVVTCTEEAVLCDSFLKRKRTLEKVMSPGGAAFLRTGEILVVCRCSDNVNMFTANGMYKRSFNCGPSPCGITVNNLDEIIITDTGAKLVRFYARDGSLIRTIEPTGPSYLLRWPIYATTNSQDDVIVSDCHQQKVLVFDESGGFKSHFQLRTQGGNQVLRPHGICANQEGDLFIIDSAIDSMEVFQFDGTFRQTLLPSDDGVLIKPKVIAISPDNTTLAIGGMRGAVRLYKFVSIKEEVVTTTSNGTSKVARRDSRNIKREIKQEIKEEVIVLD